MSLDHPQRPLEWLPYRVPFGWAIVGYVHYHQREDPPCLHYQMWAKVRQPREWHPGDHRRVVFKEAVVVIREET